MLPKLVDPRRLAERGIVYREQIAIVDLPRIAEIVSTTDSKIDVEIVFARDQQFRIRVTGFVRGSVGLECQRCMDWVETSFQQTMNLMVVKDDEQSKAVPRDVDPWEIGEQASLYELIEDEILLALPAAAKHPAGECEAPPLPKQDVVELEEGRPNPFAILKDLTKSSDK